MPDESPEQIEVTLTDEADAAADPIEAEANEPEVEILEEPELDAEPEPVIEETPVEVPVAEEEPVEELETSVEVVAELEADQAPEEVAALELEPVLEGTPAEVQPVEDVDAPVDVAAEVETDEAPEEVPVLEPEPVLEETPDEVPVAEEEPVEDVEAPVEVVAEAETDDVPDVPVLEPETEVEVESPEAVEPAPELNEAAEEELAVEFEPEPVAEMTDEVAVEADDEPEPFESSPMDAELTEDTTEDYTFEEDEPVTASPPGFLREDGTDEPVEEWVDEPFSPQTQFEVTEDEETAEEVVLDSNEWNETPVEEPADSALEENVSVGRNGHSNDGAVDNENPPETIPGEEDLSPEMAAFLKARRRVAKDNPFKGFDSPPGRF
jgi:pilus assembly protein FimV